jgi:hypothetical protein
MAENGLTIALHMLVKPNAGAGLGHDRCERGLADLKRICCMAVAAYWAAIQSRPKDKITLHQGARVVMKNWTK